MTEASLMAREIAEIPDAVRRFLDTSKPAVAEIGRRLADLSPAVTVTVARGSSDHAATYFKYACEILTGRPVASLGPSVVSVYGSRLQLAGQSRARHLAVRPQPRHRRAPQGGARRRRGDGRDRQCRGLAAAGRRALAAAAEGGAGAERRRHQEFVTSVVAALAVLAAWSGDEALGAAIDALPDRLAEALAADWSAALGTVADARSLYVLGRGPGFAVASESALKLKETSMLHAEAYSGAEVLHGPVSLVEEGFPVLAFVPADAARGGLVEICQRVAGSGAALFTVGDTGVGTRLPHAATGHPLTEPLSMLVSFYRFVEGVARARGLDPDVPRGLKKVTETL